MIIISNFISFILLTYIANSFLVKRYSSKKTLGILIIIVSMFSIFNYNGTSPLKAIILLYLYFCNIFILFRGKFINKLLVIFPFFIIQIISEIIVGYVISFLPFLNLTKNITSTGFLIGIIFSNLILIFISISFVYLSKYLKLNNLPKYTGFIFILPIFTIILLVSVNDYYILFKKNPNTFIYVIILAILNLTFAIIFLLSINSSQMKFELQIAKHKEELTNSKFDLLSQHYNYNFNLLHDLLHTCNKINSFIDNSDFANVKNEIEKLSQQTFKEFNTIYTNSVTLNYIININLNSFKENEIHIKTVLENNNFKNLDFDTQLNLFDFLIKISIENCKNVDKSQRTIIVKSKIKSNYLILQILLPNEITNVSEIKNNLQKILNKIDYMFSIKKIDTSSVSLLISFPIDIY